MGVATREEFKPFIDGIRGEAAPFILETYIFRP